LLDALRELLQLDEVLASNRLIFVCHSMGGIVARRFLVRQTVPLLEARAETGLFLVASPSLGSSYANWLSPLASFLGHTQADALRFAQDNVWLNDLDKDFRHYRNYSGFILNVQENSLFHRKYETLPS
jgi:pimeloyl-ACP methyl ester carboxylesterase